VSVVLNPSWKICRRSALDKEGGAVDTGGCETTVVRSCRDARTQESMVGLERVARTSRNSVVSLSLSGGAVTLMSYKPLPLEVTFTSDVRRVVSKSECWISCSNWNRRSWMSPPKRLDMSVDHGEDQCSGCDGGRSRNERYNAPWARTSGDGA
jgi:hypothetical protein